VSNTIRLLHRILVEHRVLMLAPSLGVHGVGPNQLQLRQAIVSIVAATSTKDYELLPGLCVCELLWPLVRR
jgi:hypothetical protein